MGKRINSIQKGKAGELELSHELQKYGFKARRSQQFCGTAGDADVIGLPGIHIECKRVEALNMDKAYEQAVADCKGTDIPAVFHRKNRKPWKVTLGLDDFIKIYLSFFSKLERREENE